MNINSKNNIANIDIDSTYRNRKDYSNPYDFSIPYKFSNRGSTTLDFLDPILETTPYTGSTIKNVGELLTGFSASQTEITLDPDDISIDNFYINRTLQINNEFSNITSYDGTNKVAIVDSPFSTIPAQGQKYYIRNVRNYINSNVALMDINYPTNTVSRLNLLSLDPSVLENFFKGSFIRYTNGLHMNQTALISKYEYGGNINSWQQENNPGSNIYIPVDSPVGFQFTPSLSGQFLDIQFTLTSFESISSSRELTFTILNGSGLNGIIVFQTTVTINNITSPTSKTFTISGGPNLYNSSTYTLTLLDSTSTGRTNGFISIYGIESDTSHISYNTTFYPTMNINVYPSNYIKLWSQPTDMGNSEYVDVLNEQGFLFNLNTEGQINQIILSLISFETISSGRSLTLSIKQGNNLSGNILYQNVYIIPNQTSATNYTFNISGNVNLSSGQYLISVLDTTSGGRSSGYINLLGISPTVDYQSINSSIYPCLTVMFTPPETIIWNQPNKTDDNFLLRSDIEQGFLIYPYPSGTLSSIILSLTCYDVSGSRKLQFRLRSDGGVSGTILYSYVINLSNIADIRLLSFDLPGAPALDYINTYTYTLQDISSGTDTGYIRIYGIQSDGAQFVSYNTSIYPYTQIIVSTNETFTIWQQNIVSTSNTITYETGYAFIPSSDGIVTNVNLNFKTNGTPTTFTMRIREDFGLSGNIIYEENFTYNVSSFTLTNIPINNAPLLSSGNNYTLTLQSSALTFLIAGDTPNATYTVYGSGAYPNINIISKNATSVFSQLTNNCFTSLISANEIDFNFTAGGVGTYVLSSFDILLTSFSYGSSRTLTVSINDNTSTIYTGNMSITDSLTENLYNLKFPTPPTLTSGNSYIITFKDNNAGTSGYMYVYGIPINNTYSSSNTNIYPRITIYAKVMISAFSQSDNPTSTSVISTSTEDGFQFIPNSSGQFSSFILRLSSFESSSSGRNLTVRIRQGTGISGNILYTGNFLISNYNPTFDYSFSTGNLLTFNINTTYTLTIIDTTSGGTSTGNVYIYGINPADPFIAYNISSYPYLEIYGSVSTSTFSQNINETVSDIITPTGQTFDITATVPGNFTSLLLNLTSFSTTGTRTLLLEVHDDLNNPPILSTNYSISNIDPPRSDYILNIPSGVILDQTTYIISLIDNTSGGNSNGWISLYGIQSSQQFKSGNTFVYPRMKVIIPSYIITLTPPQNLSGFLADNTDNIEFNTKAVENATTIFANKLPKPSLKFCKISLLSITLPYQLLNIAKGGYIDQYDYIYIHLYNEGDEKSSNILISNNPNSSQALFKIPCKMPISKSQNFLTLYSKNEMQYLKFRPDKNLRMTITLPDGTILKNSLDDNLSPLFPNPFLQISATFSLYYLNA